MISTEAQRIAQSLGLEIEYKAETLEYLVIDPAQRLRGLYTGAVEVCRDSAELNIALRCWQRGKKAGRAG